MSTKKIESFDDLGWTLEFYVGAAAGIFPLAFIVAIICSQGGSSAPVGFVATETVLLPVVAESGRMFLKQLFPNGPPQ